MMTLDDVIEAMERCSIPHYFDCKGCPYEDDDAEVGCRSDDRDADALHYLKEYQLAQNLAKLGNDPLTWDELKQMEGKPVWLVNTATEEAEWVLVGEWLDDDEMRICRMWQDDADYIIRELYGDTWQAYRKERG